jgi:hypothetical protein
MGNIILPLFGSLFLIFRVWITEIRLEEQLGDYRRFISRFGSYFYCIALILNLENELFNFIFVSTFPLITIAFLTFDVPFFLKFHKEENDLSKKDVIWLYGERILLHPPMLIHAAFIYSTGPKLLIPSVSITSIIIGSILMFGAFFVFDKRALKKEGTGIWILIAMLASLVGMTFYFFIF